MTLDDIPEGITQTLTELMDRLFKVAGCDPTCHCCQTVLNVGDEFKLLMHRKQKFGGHSFKIDDEARDVMLCGTCTIPDLLRAELNARRRRWRYLREHPRAGYSRPSKVSD